MPDWFDKFDLAGYETASMFYLELPFDATRQAVYDEGYQKWAQRRMTVWVDTLQEYHPPLRGFLPKVVPIRSHGNKPIRWCAMDILPGMSVQQVLNTYETPPPPWLGCHIFVEVYQALFWLFKQGYCHVDLAAGGNVILRSDMDTEGMPAITLIDHDGIYRYDEEASCNAAIQVLGLIGWSVGWLERREFAHSGGKLTASVSDLELVRAFYEFIWSYSYDKSLQDVWEEWGDAVKTLRNSLRTPEDLEVWRAKLENQLITEEELREVIEAGGLKFYVSVFE